MAKADLKKAIGMAITDDNFRAKLLQNPAGTLKEANLEVSEASIKAITTLDKAKLDKIAQELSDTVMGALGAQRPAGDWGW
ncbi:Os1348 family NHLP clan protein [Chloroflexota bacterium]